MQIGILSDTHGFLPEDVYNFFKNCYEIWHAGDIGDIKIITNLNKIANTIAVYGNIDNNSIRLKLPDEIFFERNNLKIYLKHTIGYPNKYQNNALSKLIKYKPDIVVTGHSHILQIIYDKKYKWLFINPGAAGIYGPHNKITLVKLTLENAKIINAKIFEKEKTI